MHQDEQNKIEIREEIIPIRKDSRKKRIRTSSISANIDEINVPDVPLKDITAKYGNIRIANLYSEYFISHLSILYYVFFLISQQLVYTKMNKIKSRSEKRLYLPERILVRKGLEQAPLLLIHVK